MGSPDLIRVLGLSMTEPLSPMKTSFDHTFPLSLFYLALSLKIVSARNKSYILRLRIATFCNNLWLSLYCANGQRLKRRPMQ